MDEFNEYEMNHAKRGLAIIVNNRHFLRDDCPVRRGTDYDATRLKNTFTNLGFEVRKYQNQTEDGIRELLAEASAYDHENSDCFVCVVLSHGDAGFVYATDEIVPLGDIFEPFLETNCPGLSGKPRLFFFQACQGKRLDHGVDLVDGGDSNEYVEAPIGKGISVIPDFLVVCSTVPGYFSWRNNGNGSWFCQAFCDVMNTMGDQMDILRLLTQVNRKVAYDYQSVSDSVPEIDGKKQIPCVISMLTKDLYFRCHRSMGPLFKGT